MSNVYLSADITAFRLVLGSLDNCKSQRSIGAMLILQEHLDCPLELDVDANPYGIPFYGEFKPGVALLSDGSPMPDGCGALGFVPPFTSRHADIEPVSASLTIRVSLPETDFEALWSTLATGRRDLVATVSFYSGPFEHVLPPGWRWNTRIDKYLKVDRANIAFTSPGWPDYRQRQE